MKTIKIAEATPLQIDYLVANVEDKPVRLVDGRIYYGKNEYEGTARFHPSTNPAQGQPILERKCVCTYASGACSVAPKNPDYWVAEILETDGICTQYGPTMLIAGLRAFLVSRLGEEAEVPEELV